ncbi:LysM peptidoglycan-binding domain-containing protein [Patescibacteria group bacterium]|nr:LysM peptidoglycan-binding domain-containing protein [Patescibacteria group bacterium]MBU4461591.1 LysM peptidoglycan-binding domain-containing protein [Patescibacteria group bacterium]MCG2699488.1 LysM peptidoglycan-binding domain-containing protein [Candidatus Parcubacteria bacterium]
MKSKILVLCHYIWKKVSVVAEFRGLFKTPCFYYSLIIIVILGLVYFSVNRFPKTVIWQSLSYFNSANTSFSDNVLKNSDSQTGVLFFGQNQNLFLELPELKIIQGDSLAALTPPRALSLKVLGALFGQGEQPRKEIIEYTVLSGNTLKSIAQNFDISLDTLLWANELTASSKIKIGDKFIILPVSGAIHFVKTGDTISTIAKTYKAQVEDIIEINEIANESDIYIGDILVIPNGVPPKKTFEPTQTYLADNYFIFPVEGKISQRLHWYNAVDIANKCGTPVFAAAPGVVQKAKYGWNSGGGNVVTILHKDSIVTWYGHLLSIFVKPGDIVDVGQKIGLVGGQPGTSGAGISTGCHLHFTVIGAKNPLAKYPFGYQIKYVQN